MKFLLDSDVLIDHLNNKNVYLSSVLKGFDRNLYISVITWSEIMYGIKKPANFDKNLTIFKNFLNDLEIKIIKFDKKIADKFIDLKIDLEKKGNRLEDFDLIIGSTAITKDLMLITKNTKHFSRIPGIKIFSKKE